MNIYKNKIEVEGVRSVSAKNISDLKTNYPLLLWPKKV